MISKPVLILNIAWTIWLLYQTYELRHTFKNRTSIILWTLMEIVPLSLFCWLLLTL